MKKILTLLVMFLATASILTAQTPKLNYQMIVRNQKATDVTIGGKVFHENDLVYSTTVTGTLKVLTNSSAVYEQNFAEATNMNGMLTIILDNTNTQNTRLEKIDWAHSKLCVIISNLGINDTTEILPVPYAFKAYTEDVITTPRIVSYLENLTNDSLALIVNTTKANAALLNAMRDTVASVIRNNPNKVKELTFYFLEKVTPADVDRAFDTVNDGVYQWFADYAKSHRSEAYQVVEYYLTHATLNDVKRLWNAAMSSDDADSIIYMVVDSVNKYVAEHPEWLKKTVKYAADHVTTAQISNTQNYIKTHNPDVYNAMKDILDSLIEANLKANKIVSGKCGDDVITLCDLQEQIDQLREYGFVRCPKFGATDISTNYQAFTPIVSNVDNIEIDPNAFWYEVTFPGTAYHMELVPATYHPATQDNTTSYISADFKTAPYDFSHRTFIVRPKTKQDCMDTATYGAAKTVECQNNCECPTFASIRQTGDSRDSLSEYQGVAVFAKLNSNYPGKLAPENGYGFEVSTDGVTYEPAGEAHFLNDGLTFTTTLGMKYCGQTLKVRAYALCVDQTSPTVSAEIECTFREMRVYITATPDSTYQGDDTITLKATNVFVIAGDYGCDGGHTPSVEQLIECAQNNSIYADQINSIQFTAPTYEWMMPAGDNTAVSNTSTQKAAPDVAQAQGLESVKYKVKCSFSLFGEGPEYTCNLYDSINIQIVAPPCPKKVSDASDNTYNVVRIGNQCWTKENMRTTKYSDGTDLVHGTHYYHLSDIPVEYGYYYSLAAATNNADANAIGSGNVQGICPNGWRVPNYNDFMNLRHTIVDSNWYCGNDTDNIGKALAADTYWDQDGGTCNIGSLTGNNKSGFSMLPAGYHKGSYISGYNSAAYLLFVDNTPYYSSSYNAIWFRFMYYTTGKLEIERLSSTYYASVRCVKDAELGQ